ncbi:hypothetical protein pb186bvf_006863 [Paramecium bursaria]
MRKGKIREIRTKSNKKQQEDEDAKKQLFYEEHDFTETGYNFTMQKNIHCSKIQILQDDPNIISFYDDKILYIYNLMDKEVTNSSMNKTWNIQKQLVLKLPRSKQCCIFNKEYLIFVNQKNQIYAWKYTENDANIDLLCQSPFETQFTGIQFTTQDRIITVNDKSIQQWDLDSFELMNEQLFTGALYSTIIKYKNSYLISNGLSLKRFSIKEDQFKYRDCFKSRNSLSNYKYNENGTLIYANFNSNCVYMLNGSSRKQIRKFQLKKVQVISQIESYKDQLIILNPLKRRISFLQIYDGEETLKLKINESQDPSFAISQDQTLIISNDCHGIKGWYLDQLF